jgi:hypothetical protein
MGLYRGEMAEKDTIKRGRHFHGWKEVIPGGAVLILLLFLPAFVGLIDAVLGFDGAPTPYGTIVDEGAPALSRALVGGLVGGGIAVIVGLAVSWVMAGRRFKLPIFFLLCLPAAMGEAAAASAFGATAGAAVEKLLPLNGVVALTLFIAWRMSGPTSLVATMLCERAWRQAVPEKLPLLARLASGWRRWRFFAGACLFAGLAITFCGAGHLPLSPEMGGASALAGPAEFIWRDPGQPALSVWAVLIWPFYIIATAAFLAFVLRMEGGMQRREIYTSRWGAGG